MSKCNGQNIVCKGKFGGRDQNSCAGNEQKIVLENLHVIVFFLSVATMVLKVIKSCGALFSNETFFFFFCVSKIKT